MDGYIGTGQPVRPSIRMPKCMDPTHHLILCNPHSILVSSFSYKKSWKNGKEEDKKRGILRYPDCNHKVRKSKGDNKQATFWLIFLRPQWKPRSELFWTKTFLYFFMSHCGTFCSRTFFYLYKDALPSLRSYLSVLSFSSSSSSFSSFSSSFLSFCGANRFFSFFLSCLAIEPWTRAA